MRKKKTKEIVASDRRIVIRMLRVQIGVSKEMTRPIFEKGLHNRQEFY